MDMRLTAALLAATMLGTAAQAADIPGNNTTKATLAISTSLTDGDFETANDSDWYKVQLKKGQDYVVLLNAHGVSAPAAVTLRDPAGQAQGSIGYDYYATVGFEYRASKAGTFFVDVKGSVDPDEPGTPRHYHVGVSFDCRDATTTKCVLEPGKTKEGTSVWVGDWDRFAVTLDAARRYDFVTTGAEEEDDCSEQLFDKGGKLLAEVKLVQPAKILNYKPKYSGKHYLRVNCEFAEDSGDAYKVLVTRK